jgi:GTP-binding protein Era
MHIVDANLPADIEELFSDSIFKHYPKLKQKSCLLVLNKIDLVRPALLIESLKRCQQLKGYNDVIPLSALSKDNADTLLKRIIPLLPIHPKFFPDDIISDAQERFFVTEIIREKILELYHEEVPYSCEVEIEEFKEREKGKHLIRAVIYVERSTQKGIILGNKGAMIKRLGELSRKGIEEFLDHQVYLELFVKVKERWRNDERALKNFGYSLTDNEG